jgi:hypothetical protein
MTFPFFGVLANTKDFRKKALELAAEENISLFKCFANMLRHAIRGDNLANIHFHQDDYGDIYDMRPFAICANNRKLKMLLVSSKLSRVQMRDWRI